MKLPCCIQIAFAAAIVTLFLTPAPPARSQDQTPDEQLLKSDKQSRPPDKWDKPIAQLSSVNRKQRLKAFDAISKLLPAPKGGTSQPQDVAFADSIAQLDPAIADRLKTAFIETLALEQKQHSGSQTNAGDFDDDYYRSLVFDVASINDPRALPLLVKELSTGDLVGHAVARFGTRAIPPLIEEGDNIPDDERNRSSCPGVLTELLQTKTVTVEANPVDYGMIRAAALHWASVPISEMRDANVLLLEQINDPGTVDALRRLAASDPESTRGPDGVVHYFVRESAQAALDRLGGMAGKGFIDRPI
jgi:hypothetical protein